MNCPETLSAAEQKYLECFCRRTRDGFFTRFSDPALPDMYDHNFCQLKKPVDGRLLRRTLEQKLEAARAEQSGFFKLFLGFDPADMPAAFPEGGSIGHNGFYLLPGDTAVELWPENLSVGVRRMNQQAEASFLAEVDLTMDAETCGHDFCVRRAERKSRVYVADGACDGFLAWLDGKVVGECTLFLNGRTAKVENLAVKPAFRHKKIASTLLKTLVQRALDGGCSTVYLVADEDDTPKELYKALGFYKVGDEWSIQWRL